METTNNVNFLKKLFKLVTYSVLLFLFTSTSFSIIQNGDQTEINQKDATGKKQGKWIYFGKDRPSEGVPLDGKIEEGTFVDDRKEGFWIKFYQDGVTPKVKGFYINNRPQGEFIKYHPNGKVKERGNFYKNQYTDSLKRYYETGIIQYEGIYNENGKEAGKIKHFYPNGQLEFEYQADNGNPVGSATRYYENGDVKEKIVYDATGNVEKSEQLDIKRAIEKPLPTVTSKDPAPKIGVPKTKGITFVPNGYNKTYNANDEIWQDGTFKNGQLWDGKVYEYDKDGILLKVKVFKNGFYHSDGQL